MKRIISFIKENDGFLIATHVNPEGDAFGSAIALSMALDAMGKKNAVFEKDPVPGFYEYMPGIERVKNTLPDTEGLSLILVDCNAPERAAVENRKFKNAAVIDHHETEKDFGDAKWVEPYAPAAGLMVYKLIKGLGLKITKEMAVNLYTAIAVDTGVFRFYNTTPEVLRVAAELSEAGANPGMIAEAVYATWSEARFRLFCAMLGDIEIKDGVAITVITKEMFRATGALPEDTESFSNYPRMIKDIKIAALFRETDEGYKASLRSRGEVNVAKIAERFGGGGHKNAAGFTIKTDIETAKKKFLEAAKGL